MSESKNLGLIFSVIFAAIIIAGSLIFFATQMVSSTSQVDDETFEAAISRYIEKQNQPPEAGEIVAVSERDYVRGNREAKVSMIEYSDFECPFCKRAHPTFQELVDNNPDTVNWVYRHFPLSFHDPLASTQATASECVGEIAGNEKFWEFTDLIFATTQSNGKGMEIEDLPLLAKKIGVDEKKVKSCIESKRYDSYIKRQISEGEKAGVRGTPGTIVIDNETGEKKLVSGAQPVSSFQAAIDELLSE